MRPASWFVSSRTQSCSTKVCPVLGSVRVRVSREAARLRTPRMAAPDSCTEPTKSAGFWGTSDESAGATATPYDSNSSMVDRWMMRSMNAREWDDVGTMLTRESLNLRRDMSVDEAPIHITATFDLY